MFQFISIYFTKIGVVMGVVNFAKKIPPCNSEVLMLGGVVSIIIQFCLRFRVCP